ncbi:DUF488 domain-containing protein [Massilia consociata]|uniref:DUF488 family protein n=1 Tax=Massilia consociata TaxID=760117 RepID=A0ABV6FLX7_9BURK
MEPVYTIGHSNRPIDEFVELLREHGIERLLDIRTVPKSRHNPQFGQDQLPQSLAAAGIDYQYVRDLGGLRRARKDTPNGAWRNASFRGYADHMQTLEFNGEVDAVARLAGSTRCALMCAEAVPWRCHRSMVADALAVRGVPVEHIVNRGRTKPHTLTPFAHVDGTRITYPPEPEAAPDACCATPGAGPT